MSTIFLEVIPLIIFQMMALFIYKQEHQKNVNVCIVYLHMPSLLLQWRSICALRTLQGQRPKQDKRHPPKSKLQVFLFGSVSKIYWAQGFSSTRLLGPYVGLCCLYMQAWPISIRSQDSSSRENKFQRSSILKTKKTLGHRKDNL